MGKAKHLKKNKRFFTEGSGRISHGLGEVFANLFRVDQKKALALRDEFLPAIREVTKQIESYPPGAERARGVNRSLDQEVEKDFIKKRQKDLVTCRKGCAYCCHLLVAVTTDEAELLAARVQAGLVIDRELLAEQASWPEAPGAWYVKDPEKNRCVFLSRENLCSVYEDRPAACRLYFSVDDPKKCDATTGSVTHQKVVSVQGEIAYSAALSVQKAGFMPKMLTERLKD